MAIDKAIAKAILGNGKRAVKNGVKNGVNGNGNGNGIKNGVKQITGGELSRQQYVKTQLSRVSNNTSEPIVEAGYAEQTINLATEYANKSPKVIEARNRYRPGAGPNRANRATSRKPAHSTIFSEAEGMKKAYANEYESIKGEIESWIRGGYAYARDKSVGTIEQPMKGYPRFIGPDGTRWRLKSQAPYGAGYRLSPRSTKRLNVYGSKRASRENPWTNEDEMEQLMRVLAKYGKAHKFAKLKNIMISEFKIAMDAIPKGYSKGHLVSLDDGGIDVAENFVPQLLKNTRQKIDGKWVTVKGNAAMRADSTDLLIGEGINNWDDYVRLKLSQL